MTGDGADIVGGERWWVNVNGGGYMTGGSEITGGSDMAGGDCCKVSGGNNVHECPSIHGKPRGASGLGSVATTVRDGKHVAPA